MVIVSGAGDGGGDFRRKPIAEPYKPKLVPIPLRAQYDRLLKVGEISEEEWIGVLMLHGIDPVPLVPV